MASFEQHLNVAVVSTGLFIVPLNLVGAFDTKSSIIALFLGLLGGIFPDLDSDTSKPINIFFKILSIFFPLLILIFLGIKMPLLYILVVWLASTLLFHFGIFKFFILVTKHRGIFHSVPMALFIGLILIYFFSKVVHFSEVISLLFGMFFIFGFIIHLILDEIFSINALGFEIKKSFGSAFKFYDRNNKLATILLYVAIAILIFKLNISNESFIKLKDIFNQIDFL